jgi:hypothetical protein
LSNLELRRVTFHNDSSLILCDITFILYLKQVINSSSIHFMNWIHLCIIEIYLRLGIHCHPSHNIIGILVDPEENCMLLSTAVVLYAPQKFVLLKVACVFLTLKLSELCRFSCSAGCFFFSIKSQVS